MPKKQVIVMRSDLNMRKGKMVAQGAHASLKAILDTGHSYQPMLHHSPTGPRVFCVPLSEDMAGWLDGNFKKICVRGDSEDEVVALYNRARELLIPCALIMDSGLTEFNGVPTITCCAIGPASDEKIDPITGHLKLL